MQTQTARALARKLLVSIGEEIVVGEAAGSIRLDLPDTSKVVVVVVPQPGRLPVAWGTPVKDAAVTRLDRRLHQLIQQGKIATNPIKKDTDPVIGPGFRKYIFTAMNIGLELTIVPQELYGVTLARLTGDAKFWQGCASSFDKGGLLRPGWKIAKGALVNDVLTSVSCPTEQAFFAALDIAEVPAPHTRTVETVRRLHREVRKARNLGEETGRAAGSIYTVDAEVDAGGKGRVGSARARTSWDDA